MASIQENWNKIFDSTNNRLTTTLVARPSGSTGTTGANHFDVQYILNQVVDSSNRLRLVS